jgi:ABC-type branched-subunit amino acid transport system ATPase component
VGVATPILEQKVREALTIGRRVYGLKLSRVALDGRPSELLEDRQRLRNLFL